MAEIENPPIFPQENVSYRGEFDKNGAWNAIPVPGSNIKVGGLSLRDYFASHAPPMTDIWWQYSKTDGHHWLDAQADWNYAYADRMLEARLK